MRLTIPLLLSVAALVGGCSATPTGSAPADMAAKADLEPACPTGSNMTPCAEGCVDLTRDARSCGACGKACREGESCVASQCALVCPGGLSVCGAGGDGGAQACVDLLADNTNCGACQQACPSGNVCAAGKCAVTCQTGATNCGGACVNLKSDPLNCGMCGAACPVGNVCSAGVCNLSCPNGEMACGGACVNPDSDANNCGRCGVVCPMGQSCANRICTPSCPPGTTACKNTCASLQSDNANCGQCGTICPMGTQCFAGSCAVTCQPSLTVCNNACSNLQTDSANCGKCGVACAKGAMCSMGVCGNVCNAPLIVCGGGCVDPRFDPSNCNGCGVVCGMVANALPGCFNGGCGIGQCAIGYRDCDGNSANGCEIHVASDIDNCGQCGRVCNAGPRGAPKCVAGSCALSCDANFGDCDGNVANGCETNLLGDKSNCGACGNVCPMDKPSCAMGVCGLQTSMSWIDPQTGSCNGMISVRMRQIRDAMPQGPLTVTITATQVAPLMGFGSWSATFPNTTCPRQWLSAWAARDVNTYNNWNPAVCQATDANGVAYFFVIKNDGGNSPQVAIYPVGAMEGQYMRVYLLDRQGAWCDLAGVNNRPGADPEVTNSNTYGNQGDSLVFTWQ